MKRLLLFSVVIVLLGGSICAQNRGVQSSIVVNSDGSYTVTLDNFADGEGHSITWFLSYRDRRISDYFETFVRGRRMEGSILFTYGSRTVTVRAWPNEVPRDHENYVTVQLGRGKRDRRDDG